MVFQTFKEDFEEGFLGFSKLVVLTLIFGTLVSSNLVSF